MKHTKQAPSISIEELSTGYQGKKQTYVVAHRITANLYRGELTCLLGANGAGKSTLLHTLSGFQPKIEGRICIEGKPIENYTPAAMARVVSVVLTEKNDLRNMSVEELVAMGRAPYTGFWGVLTAADRAVVHQAIQWVGMADFAQRMVHTLSDGERQKVMIAKALAQETPIIFLDEPTAFLDYPSKVEMMQLLHRLSREMQKTIFMSTHDLELALQIADKVWMIDKVQGVSIGTPEDLSLNGTLSRFFARKGVLFDEKTGLFRIENQYRRILRLEGHGRKYSMVRKALQRNGIDVSREADSEVCVVVGKGETDPYRLYKGTQLVGEAATIEALLSRLFATEEG